ncbi:hypothetical protein [Flavobacterium sp. UBA7682]|uniref:hypothetical protein n=1 Tax=Flavobacterium sp. UBA7682 TaxID=1946560 RepID=UPI0025BB3D57|nr:hypothetical protein [Flavobacterium sp. UBA7682]
MKLKLTVIVALLFAQITLAQDLASLKEGAQKIYLATATLDYDAILDSTYPKVFEIVSKEQMKEILIETFNGNEQMKIKLLNVAPNFEYGEIKKIGDQNFCLIDHNLEMELTLTEKIEVEEIEMMTDLMKAAMECEKVTFNQETNSFYIKKKATMIGIADAATKNQWKFINKDKENVLVNKLFSNKVVTALGM